MRINLMKTIFYIDGIKGLHANCRLVSCFVSYADEHQSNYHGITWFKFWYCWSCEPSSQKQRFFLCLLSCLSRRAVEQLVDMKVSRKLMNLRLCYSYVICTSVIDVFTVPVCGETICHQWILVARDHWSGALMVQCAVIPSPVDSNHERSAWCSL